jgi:hypothetical protein
MISYDAARDSIAEDWRMWAAAKGLNPSRPTEADFFEFHRYLKHERGDAFAALRRGGGDWIDLIMALAYHGYVVSSANQVLVLQ